MHAITVNQNKYVRKQAYQRRLRWTPSDHQAVRSASTTFLTCYTVFSSYGRWQIIAECSGMSNAITQVEASWATLMDAIEGLPEERMSEPGVAGDWSVKDVLGHVAYWEGRAIGTVERALNGEPEPDDSGEGVDTINDDVYEERANWTVARALDELHGTHERFMAALRQHPDIDPGIIEGDTFEHYDEHAADIRAWRDRVGV